MKSFKKTLIGVLLVASTLSLTSCKWIKDIMSIIKEDDDTSEVSRPGPSSYEVVESTIGQDGGVIQDKESNVKITIPQGALSVDTNISALYIEEPSLIETSPSMNFLGAVQFGPSGTTFDKPVEVNLKLTNTPKNNKVSIFCYSEEYDVWDFISEADVNNNIASFSVNHFSYYKALDLTMDMLMKFHELVKQAQAEDKPDSWILENYENYLINEKHVMDMYSLYNGYWYQPCGLLIGGNYHINGKEGDQDQLLKLIGETNMVGNTYGLCTDSSLLIDVQTYKKLEGKPKEGQEIILVEVSLYYKMIKPDIDLTASKKTINKGESATINIRCHYTNAANYFDEYKDLEMDNYMLTIKKPEHFSIDKTSVLTNNGRASFTVTAKENNFAETITVNFDVSGAFGVHAEGNITLNSAGYAISGHIKETSYFTYTAPEDVGVEATVSVSQLGVFSLQLEYDFVGNIAEEKNGMSGSISLNNVSMTLESEHLLFRVTFEGGYYYNDCDIDLFNEKNAANTYTPNIAFDVELDNDSNALVLGSGLDEIASMTGTLYMVTDEYIEGFGTERSLDIEDVPYVIRFNAGSSLLLPFTLANGEYTSTVSSLKDEMTIAFGEDESAPLSRFEGEVKMSEITNSTEQTITVTK